MSENKKQQSNNLERRDLLKGLATVPVFGLFLSQVWRKVRRDRLKKSNINVPRIANTIRIIKAINMALNVISR